MSEIYEFDLFEDDPNYQGEIMALVDAVKASVAENLLTKIRTLEAELAELRDVKKKWKDIESQRRFEKLEHERVMRDAMREAKHMTIVELVGDRTKTIWKADIEYYLGEKCPLCDQNRRVKAVYPDGEEAEKNCQCAKKIKRYVPGECEIIEMSVRNGKMNILYGRTNNDYYGHSAFVPDGAIKGDLDNFDDIELYSSYFYTAAQAQKFCDYLNKKEREE